MIELLIYTGILVLIVAVVGSTLLALARSYRSVIAEQRVEQAAQNSMQRMVREIRQASSVNSAASIFNVATSTLTLNTTDASGTPETMKFYVSTSSIHLAINGADSGPLTPSGASAASLIFRLSSTTKSTAIKIEMNITSGTSSAYHSRWFYETAALRAAYAQ